MSETIKTNGLTFFEVMRLDLRRDNGVVIEEKVSKEPVKYRPIPNSYGGSRVGGKANFEVYEAMMEGPIWRQVVGGLAWVSDQVLQGRKYVSWQDLGRMGMMTRALGSYLVHKTEDPLPHDKLPRFVGDIMVVGTGIVTIAKKVNEGSPTEKPELEAKTLYDYADDDKRKLLINEKNIGCPATPVVIERMFRLMLSGGQVSPEMNALISNKSEFNQFAAVHSQAEDEIRAYLEFMEITGFSLGTVRTPSGYMGLREDSRRFEAGHLQVMSELQADLNEVLGRDTEGVPFPTEKDLLSFFKRNFTSIDKAYRDTMYRRVRGEMRRFGGVYGYT